MTDAVDLAEADLAAFEALIGTEFRHDESGVVLRMVRVADTTTPGRWVGSPPTGGISSPPDATASCRTPPRSSAA